MSIDKRYQVFISSTFRDLVEERQAVLKAVLELDHMPAGMELFPATDESAWQLIKDVIDSSDYYVLIIGGRYGTVDEAGVGYTEKEYDYAVASRKPVIPLLHENPNNLARERTETEGVAWEKLERFRRTIESRHTCVYWSSTEGLKSKVIVSLTSAVKRHPAVGWVRASEVPSGARLADLLALRERVAELEQLVESSRTEPPPGTEDLQQGGDTVSVELEFTATRPSDFLSRQKYKGTIKPSWDEVFSGVAPAMINESADTDLRRVFRKHFTQLATEEFQDYKDLKGKELSEFVVPDHIIDTCIVQFRALGLIQESDRKRSVRDTATYWALTPYGDRLMVQLRAVRRTPSEHRRNEGSAELAPGDPAS